MPGRCCPICLLILRELSRPFVYLFPTLAPIRSKEKDKDKAKDNKGQGRVARRSLTCTNCRSRKVCPLMLHPRVVVSSHQQTRCDGTQPACLTCNVYNDQCTYDRMPPMSQVLAMAKQLQDAQDMIRQLQGLQKEGVAGSGGERVQLDARDHQVSGAGSNGESAGVSYDTDVGAANAVFPAIHSSTAEPPMPLSAMTFDPLPLLGQGTSPSRLPFAATSTRSIEMESPADLSIDEHGKVCHHKD